MRSIVAVIVCACFLQAVWLSLSSGQDTGLVCSTRQTKDECCSSNSSCVYIECVVSEITEKGCYNTTQEASCDDPAEAIDTCNDNSTAEANSGAETTKSPEEEAAVDCSKHSSMKDVCCTALKSDNSSACIFFTCTNGDAEVTGTECVAADDATPACPAEADTPSDNECQKEGADENSTEAPVNTENNENSTEAPTNTENNENSTEAPANTGNDNVTEAPAAEAVDCSSFHDDQSGCCSAGNSAACIFFNCTNTDGAMASTVCAAANATAECTGNDTASTNICDEPGSSTTPSDSDDPSQAPASGDEGDGGQQFDAASFIGGIVLCAGTVAIAFFGLKFYRSRQERNYQSM